MSIAAKSIFGLETIYISNVSDVPRPITRSMTRARKSLNPNLTFLILNPAKVMICCELFSDFYTDIYRPYFSNLRYNDERVKPSSVAA